jgi:hypothetical protein
MNAKICLRERVSKMRPKWTRWWVLQRWWWQAVSPGLMSENRRWESMYEGAWDELRMAQDRIEKLEDKNAELNRKNMLNQNGYWRIQSTENSTSCYRLDEKFIEWYKVWREPVQMKLEFEYERRRTKEEEKRYDAIYGGLIE